MGPKHDVLADVNVWRPALEKYSAVTHLTVVVYGVDGRIVCCDPPLYSTALFALLQKHDHVPDVVTECVQQCLAQKEHRPAVIGGPSYGLAVVGTSLLLDGTIVGAAVAGYALVDFANWSAITALARHAGVPFNDLWQVARQQHPIPQPRLALYGALLQVLGDTVLREYGRTRQYEETAARLKTEMAAKDEFLAVLSHELRTPLTPILGWARILRTAADSPAHRQKAVDSIERNALLQIKLIDDLLDLNRVIRDKVTLDIGVHDLWDVLRSAVDTVSETATIRKVGVEFVEAGEPLAVEGDAGRLQQVFANILSNALKFTPAGGHVRVTAERDGDTAVVRVVDTGEGIAPKFLPHIFDIFRQQEEGTRRRHSGLGIGLALVKSLVELHNGRVEIASGGIGRGTEVSIRLPVTDQVRGADGARATRGIESAPPFQDLTILVVEDTEDSLEATRIMLEVLGADVLVARDGVEALDVMATHRPDLVLCDLRMPRMDGFEFLRELSRTQGNDHPPVVAVTGFVGEADRERTQAAGFEGHINKPFDDVALVSGVRATLGHRRTH